MADPTVEVRGRRKEKVEKFGDAIQYCVCINAAIVLHIYIYIYVSIPMSISTS